MEIRLIKNPGDGTLEIVRNRSRLKFEEGKPGAIGLVQGKVIEMLVAADIAEKAASIEVSDIRGLCPQHFTALVIAGDVSSVEVALNTIEQACSKGM